MEILEKDGLEIKGCEFQFYCHTSKSEYQCTHRDNYK